MSVVPWILGAVALVVAGQMLLKVGMLRVGVVDRHRLRSPAALFATLVREPAVVAGVVVYAASALVWIYVLSRADLSFAYPFLSLAYVAVTASATVFLKERFSTRQWLGLALVVAGVAAVAAS